MDLGKIVRLKAAIEGTLTSLPQEASVTAGNSFPDAYKSLREEAYSVAPSDAIEEFDRLFPVWRHPEISRSVRGGFDPLKAGALSNEARELLGRLAGWLNGFIFQAQMQMQAEAYAKEKLKQERKVGFGS